MSFFLRPKSRVMTSRTTAVVLNTLNILSPAMLFVAVVMLLCASSRKTGQDVRNLMVLYGGILIAAALVVRIAWGMTVRRIRKRIEAEKETAQPDT